MFCLLNLLFFSKSCFKVLSNFYFCAATNQIDESSISSEGASYDVISITESLQSYESTKTVNSWEMNQKLSSNNGFEIKNDQEQSELSAKIDDKQLFENSIIYQKQLSQSSNSSIPPPPPLPPIITPKSPKEENKMGSIKSTRSNKSIRSMTEGSSGLHQVHQELKSVLTMFREKKRAGNLDIESELHIDQYSSPREVQNWLSKKGFSERTSKHLKDMSGADLLSLSSRELEHYCGITEGKKLDEELTRSRNDSSVRNTRSSELKKILGEFRKEATANKL